MDLCGQADDTDDGIQLLADIEDIFVDVHDAFIPSNQLVRELRERETMKADELTAHKLARLLKPFDVRPKPGPGKTLRGYWLRTLKHLQPLQPSRPSRPSRNRP